jgi:hypothetical protein
MLPPEAAVELLAGQVFAPPPEPLAPTDDMREFELAKAQGYPGTFMEYMAEIRAAGATNNTFNLGPQGIDYGDAPTDMAWLRNPDGSVRLDENGAPMAVRIAGTESDRKAMQDTITAANAGITAAEAEQARAGTDATSTDIIVSAAERARQADRERTATGVAGRVAAVNPETANAEIERQIRVLEAQASAQNLQAMRDASPTGGALGNVTERELDLLTRLSGALDPASPNFSRDLDDYERTLLRIVHGNEAGDRIFEQTRQKAEAPVVPMTFETFSADPSAVAAAERFGVTLEDMWDIYQETQGQ